MKSKRILTGVVLVVVALVLAGAVGLVLAQEPGADTDDVLPQGEPGAAASMDDRIPIQGRLTDNLGNPLNGTHSVVFRLYDAATAGNILCTETETVTAVNGLFNAYMDTCTASDLNGRQVWLGIKVGADAEMTPRQPIYAVPYAWGLRPGAIVSGTLNSAIVHVENWYTTGRGLRGYAMSETGTNYGVVGASRSPSGYGGYFYNNGNGIGLLGESDGSGLAGAAVRANATGSSGIALRADNSSSDGTIVAGNKGSGALFKGFGADGGEDEIRINNNGSIETKADSYVWIPGNLLRQYRSDNSGYPVVLESWSTGAMEVELVGPVGIRVVDLPIQLTGTLYGQGVKIEQVVVYYQCENAASYIERTRLTRYNGTQTPIDLVDDMTDRKGTSQTSSYTLTPTTNNSLGSGFGIMNLRLYLKFADAGHSIWIGGLRIRLGHHDLY